MRQVCAATALQAGEEFGLWGGLSEAERDMLRTLGSGSADSQADWLRADEEGRRSSQR